jgi:type IV pilus assembly protein PilM
VSKRTVGVDIGTTAIRVVEVVGIDREGMAVIDRVSIVPLAEGAIRGGRIADPMQVATALNRALKQAKLPPRGFVLGLTSRDVAVARHALPTVVKPEDRIAALRNLNYEISPLTPLSSSVLMINEIGHDVTGEGHEVAELVLAAASRADVEQLTDVCRVAGVMPRAIDLPGLGVTRAMVRDARESLAVATIVDIGASSTNVVTRQGLHVRSVRTLQVGGELVTQALREVTAMSHDEAERRKATLRLAGSNLAAGPVDLSAYGDEEGDELLADRTQTKLEEAFTVAAEQLVEAIAAAVEQDADGARTATQLVSLCGVGALTGGLKDRLRQRLGIQVGIASPWARLSPHKRNDAYRNGGEDDPVVMLSLAAAVGYALWREGK